METNRVCFPHIRRNFTLILIGFGVLYFTSYWRVIFSGASVTSQSVQIKRGKEQDYSFEELRRNLTKFPDKAKELFKIKKLNGFDLDEMVETSNFPRMNSNVLTSQRTSLLTLFTTLEWSSDKETIFNNTFMNWASLRPVVNPVLFTNDAVAAIKAMKYGWKVSNASTIANNRLPVLKYMYLNAMESYQSQYYCFANADILFDGGLIKTLVNIHYNTIASPLKNVFITGVRFNVVNVRKSEISGRQNIKNIAHTRGRKFQSAAEDYFITDRFYPWESMPEVIIASRAYDNWLVLNAREKRHLVIDASKTITAVHQSVDNDNFRSHRRDTALYNINLLRNMSKSNIRYRKGFLDCIERFTEIAEDTVVIRERKVGSYCN